MTNTAFEPITVIAQKPFHIDIENIDTDQIFAAKFLTITEKNGLGDYCFYDWRRDENGELKHDHYLNTTKTEERQILLAARNFGCGSSREHAPWALYDYGVRIIIGADIADIFFNNCLKNGMLPIRISDEEYTSLRIMNDSKIKVDLTTQTISCGSLEIPFEIEGLAKECLLKGQDQLDILFDAKPDIDAYEQALI